MSFNESVACLSLGIGALAVILIIAKSSSEESLDLLDLGFMIILGGAVLGVPVYCILVGLHWILKTW